MSNFIRDEAGATAIEYSLIVALVAVSCIVALTSLGGSLSTMFGVVSQTLNTAAGG
jgi:pilus assembly protein Flp/PilA